MKGFSIQSRISTSARWSLFTNSEFVGLWGIGALAGMIRWLEMLAVGVFVFDVTNSPFQVALMSMLRMIPLACFGVLMGALTDRFNHRSMLKFGIAFSVTTSALLVLLCATGHIQLWHLCVGTFVSGMFWALDFPVRRTLLGGAVNIASVGHAMSLDTVTNNGARLVGPVIGGILLQWTGLTGIFVFALTGYIGMFFWSRLLSLKLRTARTSDAGVGSAIRQSITLLRDYPILTGILVVTLVFNLCGFPIISMIPVIGKEVLGLNSAHIGLLMGAEGFGALIGALLTASLGQVRHYRRLYVCGIGLYLIMALIFSQSTSFLGSSICLVFVGIGVAAFAAMQSTLIFLSAPEQARSLMRGLLSVCIGIGPIGFLHIGVLGNLVGAPLAIAILTSEGIVALFFVFRKWPGLWDFHHLSVR